MGDQGVWFTWVGILFGIVWVMWLIHAYLYKYCPAFLFRVQYYIVTAFVKRQCIYDGSPRVARVLICREDGAMLHNPELLPKCLKEIYEDFETFVDCFDLQEFRSHKETCGVTVVFYKESTYGILDWLYSMDTRGFYLPSLRTIAIKTNADSCDLKGDLGRTLRHEFFHYFAHARFVKDSLTREHEEGCARMFAAWRSVVK